MTERRGSFRRKDDEQLVEFVMREHEWLRRGIRAALLCVIVLATLDGLALWRLSVTTHRAQVSANQAHSAIRAIAVDRKRRIKEANQTSFRICSSVKATNDALIEFLVTNQRLSRRLHVPGITPRQHLAALQQQRALIQSLTITCSPQGRPSKK